MTLDELRRRFSHNDGLPFCEVLSESSIQAVLDDHKIEFRDRVFTPQVTIWGGSLAGSQRGPQLPRCGVANHRTSCHQWHFDLFTQYGQLLHSEESPSHQRVVHVGQADGPRVTGKRRRQMEVKRSIRVYCRWFKRLHAGHARESKGVSAAGPPPADPMAMKSWFGSAPTNREE